MGVRAVGAGAAGGTGVAAGTGASIKMFPQEVYNAASAADLCTLTAKVLPSRLDREVFTIVVELPATTLVSGNTTAPTLGHTPW